MRVPKISGRNVKSQTCICYTKKLFFLEHIFPLRIDMLDIFSLNTHTKKQIGTLGYDFFLETASLWQRKIGCTRIYTV